MKKSLILLSLLLSSVSIAQDNFYAKTGGGYYYGSMYNNGVTQILKESEILKEHKVESREKINYFKGGQSNTIESFDLEGRIVKKESLGKQNTTTDYTYDGHGDLVKTIYLNSKGERSETNATYTEDNQLLSRVTVNAKGKYFAIFKKYTQNGEIESQLVYRKDRDNAVSELYYTYHGDGSKATTIYKVKGKIKYVWNYECKEEGELLNVKNKDQSTICIKREIDPNGNTVKWIRSFDEKGGLIKTKTVFSPDSVWMSYQRFNEEDRLLSESMVTENGGVRSFSYSKDGSVKLTYESFKDENGRGIKETQTGKWGYTQLHHYTVGLKKSDVRIYKKRMYVSDYAYSFY